MKKIKIAHLYYNLLNLYGEIGNVIALREALKKQDVEVIVDNITIDDSFELKNYDIIYIGSGTENSIELARKDILKYKDDIKKYINKKVFIVTGNALDLFGKQIDDKEALGIFKYNTTRQKERIVGEQVYKIDFLDNIIVGFQNRSSIIDKIENPLFTVISGNGFDNVSNKEGIHKNNFYGTYTIGPLLIRNPALKDYIIKNLLVSKKIPYKKILDTPDYKAYYEYLHIFNIDK